MDKHMVNYGENGQTGVNIHKQGNHAWVNKGKRSKHG